MSLLQKRERISTDLDTSIEAYQSLHDVFQERRAKIQDETELDQLGKDYIAAQRKISSQFETESNSTSGGEEGKCHMRCGPHTDCCNSECSGRDCPNKYSHWDHLYSVCCPHGTKCCISTIFAS